MVEYGSEVLILILIMTETQIKSLSEREVFFFDLTERRLCERRKLYFHLLVLFINESHLLYRKEENEEKLQSR